MGVHITFLDSVKISILSMVVVFLILVLLAFIVSLLKRVSINKKDVKSTVKIKDEKNKELGIIHSFDEIKDDDMLAALLVAVIDASENKENENIRIKSIRQID